MNITPSFQVGEVYSNDQIRFSLRVGNLGGIRPSLEADGRARHVAIFSSAGSETQSRLYNPYQDRIEEDVLIYTAAGRQGDQQLTGVNKRITEQYVSPLPILGFASRGNQMYEFLGLLELQRHYQEYQVDNRGDLRQVWLFELRIHREPHKVELETLNDLFRTIWQDSQESVSEESLDRDIALSVASDEPDALQKVVKLEEIRAKLLAINPYRFEHLLKAVLQRNGFEKVEVTRASGDGGIDLTAMVGHSSYFFAGTVVQFQAKRWRHAVGSIEINNFRGAVSSVAKGIFVTTSHYTHAAIENAYHPMKPSITLIDGSLISSIVDRSEIDLSSYT